jgi:HAD domain in Swiss Army Knife RNA repair proteins
MATTNYTDFVCVGEDLYEKAIMYGEVSREAVSEGVTVRTRGRATGVGVIYRFDNYQRSLFYTIKATTSTDNVGYMQILQNVDGSYKKLSERFNLNVGDSKTTMFNFFDQETQTSSVYLAFFFEKPRPNQTITIHFLSILPLFAGPSIMDNTLETGKISNNVDTTLQSNNTYYILSPADHCILTLPSPSPDRQITVVSLSGTCTLSLQSGSRLFKDTTLYIGPRKIVCDEASSLYLKTIKYKDIYTWYLYRYNGVQVGVPTVRRVSLTYSESNPEITAVGNVIDEGDSSVTTVGFCWAESPNPTIEDSTSEQSGAGTGEFTINDTVEPMDTVLYGRVFASNSQGTSYGAEDTFQTGICLVEDTLISLEDGSQIKIQDVTYKHRLLVWDFDNGCFSSARPMWIKKRGDACWFNKLTFKSGKILRTIMRHRIFNADMGMFTGDRRELPVGTRSFSLDGVEELVNWEIIHEPVSHYNIITEGHLNMFADKILTSCRYNNIYPIRDMKFIKEERVSVPFEQFTGVPKYYYDMMRLDEQTISIGETNLYVARLISRSLSALFVDHQGVLYNGPPLYKCPKIPDLDRKLVLLLNNLIDKQQSPTIIVSSDWRLSLPLEKMKQYYSTQGIDSIPTDYTPKIKCRYIRDIEKTRELEILSWLEQNPQYQSYDVLDDLKLGLPSVHTLS